MEENKIYLGQKTWAGKAEHGELDVFLYRENNGWTLELIDTYCNDYDGTVRSEPKVKKLILGADYFDLHTADNLADMIAENSDYKRFSAQELEVKLTLLN